MKLTTDQKVKWGALLTELWLLCVAFKWTILDPLSFGPRKMGLILLASLGSCACAYFSSYSFEFSWETDKNPGRAPLNKVLLKPPFAIWFVALAFLLLDLPGHEFILYRLR